jgi:hypothetical protein
MRQLLRTRQGDRIEARLTVHEELMKIHCTAGNNVHNASKMAMSDLREMSPCLIIAKANKIRQEKSQ